ncbi:Ankyrin repeat protein [Pandoravirus kuranda]|uniref:Ankyrin repeat protein n=1 Tax=Pandoravirus kuranda TaxID=3019033 RepID=A0AA95ED32_9VIRU|nr:Ankyrin repeat protein [Pandoravirus kuranda]
MDALPPELVSSILSWLDRDRDFCRARAAHRCFCVSSDAEVERRLGRWRNRRTPVDFCVVGLVEALEILVDRGAVVGADCAHAAVSHGHLHVLRFFVARGIALDAAPMRRRMGAVRAYGGLARPVPPPANALLMAVSGGRADIVSFLLDRGVTVDGGVALIDHAAASGDLATVELLHRAVSPCHKATTKAMDDAAAGGHLDIVQFLHANRCEGCTKDAMDGAATAGHLAVVRWLHENRPEGCTTAAMDRAASNGHLAVVRWLHENRTEGCTTAAMDCAAAGGHLGIVRWLHHNRSEGCTFNALNQAAASGHHEVVRFLHSQRTEGYAGAAINHAAARGHLATFQYLCEYRCPPCERAIGPDVDSQDLSALATLRHCVWNYFGVMTALGFAVKNGHWEVARYAATRVCHMHPEGKLPVAVNGGKNTMAAGTVAMVDYDSGLWALLAVAGTPTGLEQASRKSSAPSYSSAVFDFAAYCGRLGSVRWLHEHRTEGCTTEATDWAAINGHRDVVVYLHENRPEGCTIRALDTHDETIRQFLLHHRPDDCRRPAQRPYRLPWLPL